MMPAVILVRPRFPENIGMAARACANMGSTELILVNPERWDKARATPLATAQGMAILETLQIFPTLEEACAPFQMLAGTTARLGGWRREAANAEQAATELMEAGSKGMKTAILFGPEDRGLSNEEISHCHFLAYIPTTNASSLNLAQAVLILLYECFKKDSKASARGKSKTITHADQSRLEEALKETLLKLDCLHGQNPDYFFCQWQQLLRRAELRPHEYDGLMGFVRQLRNRLEKG